MRHLKLHLKLISYFVLLTACGFKPVYKHDAAVAKLLGAIEIAPIVSVDGAEFCHYLSQLLPKVSAVKYLLAVNFTYSSSPAVIDKNSDIIRDNITQMTKYELLDMSTNKIVTTGKFTRTASYNATYSPYGVYVEQNSVKTNLIKHTAEEIHRRLIFYFNSQEL